MCALLNSAGAAESGGRVVIVGSPTSPLVRRLREEAEALGFLVDVKPEVTGPLASELEAADSVAAMRVLDQPSQSLELVIADPKRHQVFHDELPIRTAIDPTAAELVATRAIELLRAIRLGVPTSLEPVVQEKPPKPAPAVETAKPTPRVSFAGPGVSLAPLVSFAPGLEFGTAADVTLTYVPVHVGFDVGVVLPITSQRLQHEGGDISASSAAVHAALLVRSSTRSMFGLGAGLGLEAARVHFEGMAPAPLINAGATVFTYGPRLELIAALRLAPKLRLVLPFAASYVLPRTVIRFSGEPLRDWGPVLMRVGIGMEWTWL